MKKANPFKPGDTAYHPGFGKVKVIKVDDGPQLSALISVEAPGWLDQWTMASLLSFEPWPNPVHERPMQDGYYLVRYKDYKRTYLAHYNTRGLYAWKFVLEPSRNTSPDELVMQEDKVVPLSYLGDKVEWWPG